MVEIEVIPRRQFRPYLTRSERFACLVCHRRAGKTYSCLQDLLVRSHSFTRKGPMLRFGYIAPTRDQAKDIAWNYLKSFVHAIPEAKPNEQDLSVTFKRTAHKEGAMIRLYSGESYERMRGLYFDGVVIDEPADIDPDAWPKVVLPCLTDYDGWATFIGTPKGKNAFHKQWMEATKDKAWFTMMLKASQSGILTPEQLAIIKRAPGMTDEAFQQEYECDFSVANLRAIYGRFLADAYAQNRIGPFPIDGRCPVHTSWDLGGPHNTVVWYWQRTPFGGTRFIDVDYGLNLTLVERVAWMNSKGYTFGRHFFPHDAKQTARTGRTFEQDARDAGLTNTVVVPPIADVWQGINHVAELFPTFEFRTPACEKGLEGLDQYQTAPDASTGVVRNMPLHTWASHIADALRTMAEAEASGLIPKDSRNMSSRQSKPIVALTGSRMF